MNCIECQINLVKPLNNYRCRICLNDEYWDTVNWGHWKRPNNQNCECCNKIIWSIPIVPDKFILGGAL